LQVPRRFCAFELKITKTPDNDKRALIEFLKTF